MLYFQKKRSAAYRVRRVSAGSDYETIDRRICSAVRFGRLQGNETIKIGSVQLVDHPALDAAYKGFVDGLSEAGYTDGTHISIDYENAQGEQANCVTIAQKLVNDRSDLILAIATPAAQAVANLTKDIPILVTAVTDPASAKLVKSNDAPGTNVTGTSDLTPCAAQIDKLGLAYIDATASSTNEVQQVTQSLVGKVDAIYVPTDNMFSSSIVTVVQVANEHKIPTIVGEEAMIKRGALATYGIDYYALGKQTASMAIDIIKNGKKPADMPIQYLEHCTLGINGDTAAKIGISIPDDLK